MKLILKDIKKSFGDKQVLKGVSFDFEKGKIYGLLGRNGAGKTTLFNCLSREIEADRGEALLSFDETDNTDNKNTQRLEPESIGYVFTSNEYIELVKSYQTIKISMDKKDRATDNIAIERFFRSLKWERLDLMYPENVTEVKTLTKEYIENYNYHRGHQSYDYKTPSEVYFGNIANAA